MSVNWDELKVRNHLHNVMSEHVFYLVDALD
jgi:hypothetical protein